MKRFLLSASWKVNLLFLLMIVSFVGMPFALRPMLLEMNFYQLLLVSQGLIWLPVLPMMAATRTNLLKPIPLRMLHPVSILLLVIMAYCLLPVASALNLITQWIGSDGTEGISVGMEGPFWLNLLFVAVLPAVSEELVCRGIFFGNFKKQGIWLGVLFSAFCFGMLHMNLNQFSYAFVIGTAFAIADEATGSIFAGMVMHFTFNANSVIILELEKRLVGFAATILPGEIGFLPGAEFEKISDIPLGIVLLAVVMLCAYSVLTLFLGYLALVCISKLAKNEEHMKKLFGRFWLITGPQEDMTERKECDLSGLEDEVPSEKHTETKEKMQNRVLDLIFGMAVLAGVFSMIVLR